MEEGKGKSDHVVAFEVARRCGQNVDRCGQNADKMLTDADRG